MAYSILWSEWHPGPSTRVIPNTVSALAAATALRFGAAKLEDLSQAMPLGLRPVQVWLMGHSFPKRASNDGRITVPFRCYFIDF
jgi:hypothetical protein